SRSDDAGITSRIAVRHRALVGDRDRLEAPMRMLPHTTRLRARRKVFRTGVIQYQERADLLLQARRRNQVAYRESVAHPVTPVRFVDLLHPFQLGHKTLDAPSVVSIRVDNIFKSSGYELSSSRLAPGPVYSEVNPTMTDPSSEITLTLLHPTSGAPIQSWSFRDEAKIRIGRASDNEVVIRSEVVSRYHAELRRGEGGWLLVGLGSNGTFLNGTRITEVALADGHSFVLAPTGPSIGFRLGQAAQDLMQQT